MQAMANRYARYYNALNKRTGTIWEGRYKSCLVDSENYLFTLYKYIEMNPVKAKIVENVADYPWSSYSYNGLGQADKLLTEHALYTELSNNRGNRCRRYNEMFNQLDLTQHQKQIKKATLAWRGLRL